MAMAMRSSATMRRALMSSSSSTARRSLTTTSSRNLSRSSSSFPQQLTWNFPLRNKLANPSSRASPSSISILANYSSSRFLEQHQKQQTQKKQQGLQPDESSKAKSKGGKDYFKQKHQTDSKMSLVNAIVEDHQKVADLYKQYTSTNDKKKAQELFHMLVWEVARHSVAEEVVVYPLLDNLGAHHGEQQHYQQEQGLDDQQGYHQSQQEEGHELARISRQQHEQVKVLLKELDDNHEKVKTPDFDAKLNRLITDLGEHMHLEETESLPKLEKVLSSKDDQKAFKQFELRKKIAPTRPHPSAPTTPSFLGTASALIFTPLDKAKDLFRDFPSSESSSMRESASSASQKTQEMMTRGKERVKEAVDQATGDDAPTAESLAQSVNQTVGNVLEKGADLYEKGKQTVRSVVDQVTGEDAPTAESVAKAANEKAGDAFEKGSEMLERGKEKGAEMMERGKERGAELYESGKEKGAELYESGKEKGAEMLERGKERGSELYESGKEKVKNTAEQTKKNVKNTAQQAKENIPSAESMADSANEKAGNTLEKGSEMIERGKGKAKGAVDQATGKDSRSAESFANSVNESAGNAAEKASDMLETGKEKAKDTYNQTTGEGHNRRRADDPTYAP